jgi:hypothetical protein
LRGLTALFGVFVAGGLAGAAVERAYFYPRPPLRRSAESLAFRPGEGDSKSEDSGTGARIPFGLALLDLTPAQEREITAIADHLRPATDSLWREMRPRAMAVAERMLQESACVLSPTQIEQFKFHSKRAGASPDEIANRLKLVTSGACPTSAPK